MENKVKIFVVEDEKMLRENLEKYILDTFPECEITGEYSNGQEALKDIEVLRPHIVFTDIKMPYMDGIELAKEIKINYPYIYTVIITGFSDFEYAQQAIRCGVFDYLLKPVKKDKLYELLHELIGKVNISKNSVSRNVVTSKNYPIFDNDMEFGIFLIQFGNNCSDLKNDTTIKYYKRQEEQLNWVKIFHEKDEDEREWFLSDENVINVKCLVTRIHQDEAFECKTFAKKLMDVLGTAFTDSSVNICYMKEYSTKADIWNNVKFLRKYMNRLVTIGESCVFSYSDIKKWNQSQKILEMVKYRIQEQLERKIKTRNKNEIIEEVTSILNFVSQNQVCQMTYEKIVEYILHVFEFSGMKYDEEILDELWQIYETQLTKARSCKEISSYFLKCIDVFFQSDLLENDTHMEQFMDYIDMNYTNIESVKSVADKFNYNYTYFSRLFKQYKGISLSKYITKKRIELAKQLMEENSEMGVLAVCEKVGYEDQHYFSRVFRKEVGLSPSEYKINDTCKKSAQTM